MSRASTVSARNLSLTEELEKLEQSITLTLQEIDHNFSRAHRIVTTSILPVVEQYAEHSKAVWEGSRFWKQFFEASANVSLSGYEELAASENGGDDQDVTATTHDETGTGSPSHHDISATNDDTITTARPAHDDDSLLPSTPRASNARPNKHTTDDINPSFASYSSPYETLRRELTNASPPKPSTAQPRTPASKLPDMSMNALSSPFEPTTRTDPPTTARRPQKGERDPANPDRGENNPLLHRVLDKTYRLQATPHGHPSRRLAAAALPDSSPLSSPDVQAPKLHSEIFSSPVRAGAGRPPGGPPRTPRPGVSVLQTPGRSGGRSTKTRKTQQQQQQQQRDVTTRSAAWDDSDDSSSEASNAEGTAWAKGTSPPKSMQYAVPQSRLLQTPAREASKRIVSDLLLTAGANDDTSSFGAYDDEEEEGDDDDGGGGAGVDPDPTSPVLVRGRGGVGEDETF
ncbi:MAG: DASH complex subunit ask1 [Piccolia ochrophora]|nr:MAG: DASH complex subunit ask1 [Piccolia ochrophora]